MFSDQKYTPLFKALTKYSQGAANLHVPAHRQGAAAPSDLAGFAGREVFKLDLTEIRGLDDLHNCRGVIAKAQELAARLYGADSSFFLVNGTSCGLQALLMAAARPGEKVILPRNMHRSVLAGLVLGGADPEYIVPEVLPVFNFLVGFTLDKLKILLDKYPEAKAALAVYPTYYGVGGDIKEAARLLHERDKPLLVDEAHGAHLGFHPALPARALELGADAVVQSTHKLGGAMTQASMLHLKGGRVDKERVEAALRLVQSTSPSYILMASLDAARRQLALQGEELLGRAIKLVEHTKGRLRELGFKVLDPGNMGLPGASVLDPTKLVINTSTAGLNGYRVAETLARDYNVHVEMADPLNIVAVISIGTTEKDCRSLVVALRKIIQRASGIFGGDKLYVAREQLPEKVLTPRDAWFAPSRKIPLAGAAGEVSAEWLAVYPPGIPILLPGEVITGEIISCLQEARERGFQTQGMEDSSLTTVKVVEKCL